MLNWCDHPAMFSRRAFPDSCSYCMYPALAPLGLVLVGAWLIPAKVIGFAMGFPCTSVSSQNAQPQSFEEASSATGGGFRALLAYLDYNDDRLELVITENVRNLLYKQKKFNDETPIDIINREMGQRGFAPSHTLVTSRQYGAPQSRSRVWGLYIKVDRAKAQPSDVLQMLTLPPAPLAYVLEQNLAVGERRIARSNPRSAHGGKRRDGFQDTLLKYGKADRWTQRISICNPPNAKGLGEGYPGKSFSLWRFFSIMASSLYSCVLLTFRVALCAFFLAKCSGQIQVAPKMEPNLQ